MKIPSFGQNGVLPPYIDNSPTVPAKRSPFKADVFELVERFCTSRERAALLMGLNAYRTHLFNGGFVSGDQWIDGSFVEDVETVRGRPPKDIDVVTLFNRPLKYQSDAAAWDTAYETFIHADFFATKNMKPTFCCDTFSIDLNAGPTSLVRDTMYWGGLFSDIRASTEKKGIVSIPLSADPMEFVAVKALIRREFDV